MTITPPAAPVPHTYADVDETTYGQNSIAINHAYSMGRPFQWAREFTFNSVEAGATKVHFTVDFLTARKRGIYRLMIIDNASGMTRPGLSDCINHIGGGLSKRGGGSADNLGQGAKFSSAYFNPAGVVYLTRTVEDGDAIGIYVRSTTTGEYGLLRLYGLNDDGVAVRRSIHRPQPLFFDEAGTHPFDDGTDWEAVMDEAFAAMDDPESGTAVIFMGQTGTEDTIYGDPERPVEAGKYALMKYLDSRIWEIPANVEISVKQFDQHNDKSKWPRSESEPRTNMVDGKKEEIWQWRTAHGLKRQINDPDYLVHSGTVPVVSADGIPARVDWVITKFASVKKSGAKRATQSSTLLNPGGIGTIMAVSAAAKMGLYDVMDFQSRESANARFRDFGIDNVSVQEKLWFTVTPQVYRPKNDLTGDPLVPGVGMDPSRSHLVATSVDRHSEPIETLMREWGRDFQTDAKFPPEIKALLDAAWASTASAASELDGKTAERIAKNLAGALKREIAIIGGRTPTVFTRGGSGFKSPRRGRKPGPVKPGPVVPGGNREGGPVSKDGEPATKTTIEAVLPEVRWVPGDNPAWNEPEAKGAIALFRLPGLAGGNAEVDGKTVECGVVWLRGTDPGVAPSDRKDHDGNAYTSEKERLKAEAPVILAAVQDKQSEPGYGPAQAWGIEAAVKEAYVACAKAVAGHLLAQGGWDPATKSWDPKDGVTENQMASAVEPFNFSNALRGYYPQKQIAAGFMGSITKSIRSKPRKKAA